jgi:hypothetical protein
MRHLVPIALACLASLAPAQEPKSPRELVSEVLARLDEHADRELAAAELRALGAPAVPAVFDAFVGARGARMLALQDAIQAAPNGALNAAITAAITAAPPPGPHERLQRAALKAMELAGTSRDFDLCLLAAKVLGEETFAPRTSELSRALDAIFARDPDLLGIVRRSWLSIEKRLRTPVARSVGNLGGDGAIEFLADLLARDDANAGMLLSQLGRASRGISRETADYVASIARRYIDSDTQGIVKEAAVLAGRLRDDSAVPDLIELLGEESQGIVGNVHWALKEITGLSLPADEKAWASWHARETAWWSHESASVFRDLSSREPSTAAAAVREVACHRLGRHLLALELAGALSHRAPAVRIEAADGLRRLGSNAALPALLAVLEDANEGVSASVRAAIVELGGHIPGPADDSIAGKVLVRR